MRFKGVIQHLLITRLEYVQRQDALRKERGFR